MRNPKRTLPVALALGCAGALLACSDDGAVPQQDLGRDLAADVVTVQETAPSDTAADKSAPPMDGPFAEGGADQGTKDQGAGTCKAWSQWTCALPGANECRASCTVAGMPLQLECSDKGGQADCECKKSGVKTSCSYSGPAPTGCDACKSAFKSGCCNPP